MVMLLLNQQLQKNVICNKSPCNYGGIYKRLFAYLPVVCVSFDKPSDDDKQEYKHID